MTALPRSRQLLGLLVALLAVFAAGALGALGSADAPGFYAQLNKPDWAPPAWLFGPAWTTLYTLMALAVWLVWRSPCNTCAAISLFALQLAANALWSWVFFAWRQGALAMIEIVILWLLIALTMVAFWRASRLAAGLLVPYLSWVSFAVWLTWTLWQANPALL